jgi:hypothetical protein
VTVRDTTAPVVTVSGAKTAIATSTNGAVVTYTAPTATDIVDGAGATTSDKASGSTFALGTTTVTCTAKNAAGNVHTKSFTVTVTAAWSNVLQPVNGDGSPTFKLGSTVPASNATTGNLFRYDATSARYIFNTKTLSAGTYQLRIDLSDGVSRTVNISLR